VNIYLFELIAFELGMHGDRYICHSPIKLIKISWNAMKKLRFCVAALTRIRSREGKCPGATDRGLLYRGQAVPDCGSEETWAQHILLGPIKLQRKVQQTIHHAAVIPNVVPLLRFIRIPVMLSVMDHFYFFPLFSAVVPVSKQYTAGP